MIKTYLKHKTPNNEFIIHSFIDYLPIEKIDADYKKCSDLCEVGCKNYDKKYSCPPLSPDFKVISKMYKYMVVNALKIDLETYKQIYNTIRMSNVVSKSIQRKIFDKMLLNDNLPEKLKVLENGSCRLCKTCLYQKDLPCKYPEKMRPSLEACGVNVDSLVKICFDFNLVWYNKKNYPSYQCVVSGILTNYPDIVMDLLNKEIERHK